MSGCSEVSFFSSLRKRVKRFFQCDGAKERSVRKRVLSSGLDPSFAAMEVSNQLKHVFNLIDSNGDGKISSCELGEMLSCLGWEKSAAAWEAERMVTGLDWNGDGFIDLDEFMGAVSDDGKSAGNGKEEEYLMDAFLIFDADKNGLISARELQKVLIGLGICKNCSLKDCRRMIKGVDRDGDGFVDFQEFLSMMKATNSNSISSSSSLN